MRACRRKRTWGSRLEAKCCSSFGQMKRWSFGLHLSQGGRYHDHKRCQSQEIKGHLLSCGLLGFSSISWSRWWDDLQPASLLEPMLTLHVWTNKYEPTQTIHSPPAWKKDDGMNDVLCCYTLQTWTCAHTGGAGEKQSNVNATVIQPVCCTEREWTAEKE